MALRYLFPGYAGAGTHFMVIGSQRLLSYGNTPRFPSLHLRTWHTVCKYPVFPFRVLERHAVSCIRGPRWSSSACTYYELFNSDEFSRRCSCVSKCYSAPESAAETPILCRHGFTIFVIWIGTLNESVRPRTSIVLDHLPPAVEC